MKNTSIRLFVNRGEQSKNIENAIEMTNEEPRGAGNAMSAMSEQSKVAESAMGKTNELSTIAAKLLCNMNEHSKSAENAMGETSSETGLAAQWRKFRAPCEHEIYTSSPLTDSIADATHHTNNDKLIDNAYPGDSRFVYGEHPSQPLEQPFYPAQSLQQLKPLSYPNPSSYGLIEQPVGQLKSVLSSDQSHDDHIKEPTEQLVQTHYSDQYLYDPTGLSTEQPRPLSDPSQFSYGRIPQPTECLELSTYSDQPCSISVKQPCQPSVASSYRQESTRRQEANPGYAQLSKFDTIDENLEARRKTLQDELEKVRDELEDVEWECRKRKILEEDDNTIDSDIERKPYAASPLPAWLQRDLRTTVCGFYSPSTRPGGARPPQNMASISASQPFRCILCGSNQRSIHRVKSHFFNCVKSYGNPSSYNWYDDRTVLRLFLDRVRRR